jgi:peptidoglycan/LPS O-acetylase OafA/YrhL
MQATTLEVGNTQRNLDIEALRGIAIIVTLVAHIVNLDPQWGPLLTYFWLGIGVDLFFAISGFVITASFKRHLEIATSANFAAVATAFWLRRIFRLWPAAMISSSVVVMAAFLLNDPDTFGSPVETFRTWVATWLQLTNVHLMTCNWFKKYVCNPDPLWHYWSLSLEEQFYFTFPFLVFFLHRRLWLVAAILALYQCLCIRPWSSPLWFFRTDALLWGVMIGARWTGDRDRNQRLAVLEGPLIGRMLVAGALLLLLLVSRPSWSPYYMGLVGVVAGGLVWIASFDRNYFARGRVSQSLARYVGSRSYSIYLVHLPVFALVRYVWLDWFAAFPSGFAMNALLICAAFGMSLLVAEFSYRAIEAPLRVVGRRLADDIYCRHLSSKRAAFG